MQVVMACYSPSVVCSKNLAPGDLGRFWFSCIGIVVSMRADKQESTFGAGTDPHAQVKLPILWHSGMCAAKVPSHGLNSR